MEYESYIDQLKLNIRLESLNNMKNDCRDEYYKNRIDDIISFYSFKATKKPKENKIESDVNKRLNKFNSYCYRKKWSKLLPKHKEIKLKEFLKKNLKNCSKDNKKIIIKSILDDLSYKKLNYDSIVKYDISKEEIISIKGLEYDVSHRKFLYLSQI